MTKQTKVHGNTQKAADTSLARKEISPESRVSKDEQGQECWCGCGEWTNPNRRWKPGHDARAKGIIKRAVEAGTTGELADRLREYGQERGLISGETLKCEERQYEKSVDE